MYAHVIAHMMVNPQGFVTTTTTTTTTTGAPTTTTTGAPGAWDFLLAQVYEDPTGIMFSDMDNMIEYEVFS